MQSLVPQWHQICSQLAAAQPSNLSLYVICDCGNLETATDMVRPLLRLQKLSDFGIRLAPRPQKALHALAYSTVLQLTNQRPPSPTQAFRFLSLPRENQIRVLEHTLVQSTTVYCTNSDGGRMSFGSKCETKGNICPTPSKDDALLGYFCKTGHSAFNFRCRCEGTGFPGAMFLVNRSVRQLCTYIFYGRNTFNVALDGFNWWPENGLKLETTISMFPSGSLKFLTHLILNDGDQDLESLQPDHSKICMWDQSIDLLSKFANLAMLTLEVRFSELTFRLPDYDRQEDAQYLKEMVNTYVRLFERMACLKGLKNMFVHLNYGSSVSGERGRMYAIRDGRAAIEERLERVVLGSEYDAWSQGKTGYEDPTKWEWLHEEGSTRGCQNS